MITSRHNPAVQAVRLLSRKRPQQEFLLEGPHLIGEALAAGVSLDTVLASPRADAELLERVRGHARRVVEVSDDILAYAADSQRPQGLVGIGRVPELRLSDDEARGRLLLLDEVRDPGNLGTMARTAWASGVAALLLVGRCVDPWNPKVVRASAGALFRLPVLQFEGAAEAGDWLRGHGQRLLMASARGRLSCFEVDLGRPLTLVLGSEAHGVGPDVAALCDDSVRLPMAAGCESLNLSATAAVLLYLALERDPDR